MKAEFVELEVSGLKALVPSLRVLPAAEIFPLFADAEAMERFVYTANLLRKYISEEHVETYESLDFEDMVDFVSQWVSKSTPITEGDSNE